MKSKKIYYIIIFILTLILLLTIFWAILAIRASASVMRLRKAEGTVQITGGKDEKIKTREDMNLYDGYNVKTKSESYAWVELDSVKLTKLDQLSRAEIEKKGKKLTINVKSGNLFFNITEPLEDDESLDIRTSTLGIGIRGTCGWVEVPDSGIMRVFLLEGKVSCETEDGEETINAGEMAVMTEDGTINIEKFSADDIPGFVMAEVKDDDRLMESVKGANPDSADSLIAESGETQNTAESTDAPQDAAVEQSTETQESSKAEQITQVQQSAEAAPTPEPTPAPVEATPTPEPTPTPVEPTPESAPAPKPAPVKRSGFIPWSEAGLTDHVMDWKDEYLAMCVADTVYIYNRPIMLSDVWEIREVPLKGVSDISALEELTNLTNLSLDSCNIGASASVLGNLTNLTNLHLASSNISDLSPLSRLTNLTYLSLGGNKISDLSPLRGLTKLQVLILDNNNISDVSALGNLTNLTALNLGYNSISDLSPLGNLTNLQDLDLACNPITDYSPVEFVPQLYK